MVVRSDKNKQVELLKNSILKLPPINIQILDVVMRLFNIVTRNNDINSMGAENIGLWYAISGLELVDLSIPLNLFVRVLTRFLIALFDCTLEL
jgi:hypothetical protein